jgi:hypothetical protein
MSDRGGPSGAVRAGGTLLALGLLGAQLAAFVYAHGVQPARGGDALDRAWNGCADEPVGCTRYFSWAPNDYLVTYELAVRTADGLLSQEAARARYQLPLGHWEFPVEHLQDIVRQYETTYAEEPADVALRYSVNGRGWRTWEWHG